MPAYRFAIEITVDHDDIDAAEHYFDQIRELDGVTIDEIAPFADNPPDYPDEDWWAENPPE